jgi:hypothetical protein
MRPHGRARVDPQSPEAFAVCDRCRMLYNRVDLKWQHQYAGNRLVNIRLLVCGRCLDKPHEFNRPLVLPPDPVPVADPRPDNYAAAEGPAPPNLYVAETLGLAQNLPAPPTGIPAPRPIQFAD